MAYIILGLFEFFHSLSILEPTRYWNGGTNVGFYSCDLHPERELPIGL